MPRSTLRPVVGALLLLAALLAARPAPAQDALLPAPAIPLDDLAAFRDPGPNWSVAGGVRVDRRIDADIEALPGTGVLVNQPGDAATSLWTEMEHGDAEIEVEYLLPKGSNSGLYLMGRYELQLIDSWGVGRPRAGDAGGIYQRWDPARGAGREGYEGRAPRVNASRAPGLWQHLRIVFEAPRFDAAGRKVRDARFVRVEHNGVVIHDRVTLTGPTRGAFLPEEAPTGPLVVQGDHGPVALRNLRVKPLGAEPARLADLRYRAFAEPTLDPAGMPTGEAAVEAVSAERTTNRDRFTLVYEGTFEAPRAGTYAFDVGLGWVEVDPNDPGPPTGGARLVIGDEIVLEHGGRTPHARGTVDLAAGAHPFRLVLFKNRPWSDPRMTLLVEGPGFAPQPLHDADALPPVEGVAAILLEPGARPVVQRGFMVHGGGKRTHAAAVGDPAGVHYAVDLATGGLLYVWRGPFVETTQMWHGRGTEQTAEPLGAAIPLDGAPPLARRAAAETWPLAAADYRFEGYALDADGRPTFAYYLAGTRVEDAVRPALDGRALHRRLRIADGAGLTLRLAAGARIEPAEGGGFRVDDRLYVEPDAGLVPEVRATADGAELVVRLPDGPVDVGYHLVW